MAALGTRSLTVSIGGTDYTASVATCEILSGETESDFVSFADAAAGGGRTYKLHIVAVQDLTTTSFWNNVWANAGTDVAYLIKPYGNSTATASQPHYSGNATITEPDGVMLGGDADKSTTQKMTIEVEWVCTAKPTKVIA
jgi:hypothetical protein